MTAIHLAEQQSGRRLFLRWAKATDGQVSMFEVGSCSEGFRGWSRSCVSMPARGCRRLAVAGLSRKPSSRRREYGDAREPGHHPLPRQRLPAMPGLNRRWTP